MSAIWQLFRPAPTIEPIQDRPTIDKTYKYWRMRTFYTMYIGYTFFYFTRKSFTFAMPSLMDNLGFDEGQLGFLATVMALTYGLSKFVSGVLSDRSNPRYFMGFGLMLTGVMNIFFGFSSSLLFFAIFWGLNAWFQGFGWPPCAKLLTHWYSQKERGVWWSVCSTSHNVGGALIPLVAAFFAQEWGWRAAMFGPGILCIFVGFFIINRLRDTPPSLGLPPIEEYRNDYPPETSKEEINRELSLKEILVRYILTNKYIWVLAISYFFVYVVRQAVNDWTVLFLVKQKGYSQLTAAGSVCWFEIGGFLGGLLAGWSSDKLCKGKRGPINVVFSILALAAVLGFFYVPDGYPILDAALLFVTGFAIFGPQMLIGVAAVELSHKKAAASANGFVSCFGYLGAAVAGYPLGIVIRDLGWDDFFGILAICAAVCVLVLIPLWNVRGLKTKA